MITHEIVLLKKYVIELQSLDKSRIAEIGDVEEVFIKPKSTIAKATGIFWGTAC